MERLSARNRPSESNLTWFFNVEALLLGAFDAGADECDLSGSVDGNPRGLSGWKERTAIGDGLNGYKEINENEVWLAA